VGVSALGSNVRNIVLPDTVTHVEHDLPQAPPLSGNALLRYEFPVADGLLALQTDVQYTDNFCFTVLCAPVEKENSYTVTNARIGYGSPNKRWEISGFVNNLADTRYRVYAFDSSLFAGVVAGVYAKPRTYGLTATYHFGSGY
jgi:iron complex outermembrane receptor protein